MKIWIDVRNISIEQNKFVLEFINYFNSKNKDNILNIYSNSDIEWVKIIKSKNFNSLFWEQILFLKRLLDDKNDLVITFNDTFPIFYNKRFIQIITSLEKLLYPNIENSKSAKKHTYQTILKSNLKKAEKIICFDEKTKKDINEKLNIDESKIEIIPGFFYSFKEENGEINLQINIKQKHWLTWDYLIYNSETWTNKNIKRMLEAISKTNISLIFIWNKISSDIETRELIMRFWVKDKIIFAWNPDDNELWFYYKQSLWVIFPLLYSSFPFYLNDVINFKTAIISSNIDEIKNIFWDKANYFSPISTIEITENIEKIIKLWKKEVNYDTIIKKYSANNFISNLSQICQI